MKCLFIGGEHDGELYDIKHPNHIISFPVYKKLKLFNPDESKTVQAMAQDCTVVNYSVCFTAVDREMLIYSKSGESKEILNYFDWFKRVDKRPLTWHEPGQVVIDIGR